MRYKYNTNKVKKYFLAAVDCFGVENMRFSQYKRLFRDNPVMLEVIRELENQKASIVYYSRQPYYGPTELTKNEHIA